MTSLRRSITSQIARTTKGNYYRALYQAQDAGLLPTGTDYARFVCLSTARTGSTLLMRSLAENPAIRAYGEIVRNYNRFPTHIHQFAGSDELFEEDPRAFLDSRVFRRYPEQVKAVGFKIFYHHAPEDQAWGQAVWSYLLSQPALRIIHLKRSNLLQAYVSRMRAEHTGQWIKYGTNSATGSGATDNRLMVDCDEVIQFFEKTRAMEVAANARFADRAVLQVVYEDIVADFSGEMTRMQTFLGLEPVVIRPATQQRPSKPLSHQVANYDELRDRLNTTEWVNFLGEAAR